MRWSRLSRATKITIVLVVLWLIVSPFLAGHFADPVLFLNAPWLILFGLLVLFPIMAWLLRRLGH
jgi:hypothetical protein